MLEAIIDEEVALAFAGDDNLAGGGNLAGDGSIASLAFGGFARRASCCWRTLSCCMRERSAIVRVRIVVLPEAPMTPAIAGRAPPSAPSARGERSVSEEWRSKRPLISMPTPPPPPSPPPSLPPLPLGMEGAATVTLHASGCC